MSIKKRIRAYCAKSIDQVGLSLGYSILIVWVLIGMIAHFYSSAKRDEMREEMDAEQDRLRIERSSINQEWFELKRRMRDLERREKALAQKESALAEQENISDSNISNSGISDSNISDSRIDDSGTSDSSILDPNIHDFGVDDSIERSGDLADSILDEALSQMPENERAAFEKMEMDAADYAESLDETGREILDSFTDIRSKSILDQIAKQQGMSDAERAKMENEILKDPVKKRLWERMMGRQSSILMREYDKANAAKEAHPSRMKRIQAELDALENQ